MKPLKSIVNRILNKFLMKKFGFLVIVISFMATNSFCQSVKTKDGKVIGERNEFIKSCTHGAEKELMKINGLEIEADKYCSCVCDNLIPTINSWVLEKAINENTIDKLLQQDENLKILMKCLEGNFSIKDDYKFNSADDYNLQKKVGIETCVKEVLNNDKSGTWTRELAHEYCDCALEKLYSKGFTYKEILELEDKNSATFNEIAVPCVSEVLNNKSQQSKVNDITFSDIVGGGNKCAVSLIDYFGNGYKIKLSLSGIIKYFLLDTGASDLIIDRETERELLMKGILKEEDYLNKTKYELANGETVTAQKLKINNVSVGDYTVNNLTVAVIDDGSLLCGKSFLDKFKKWELDKEKKVIILYK